MAATTVTGAARSGAGAHLGGRRVDDLLGGQVALVADNELVDALGGVAVDLTEPARVRAGQAWSAARYATPTTAKRREAAGRTTS